MKLNAFISNDLYRKVCEFADTHTGGDTEQAVIMILNKHLSPVEEQATRDGVESKEVS